MGTQPPCSQCKIDSRKQIQKEVVNVIQKPKDLDPSDNNKPRYNEIQDINENQLKRSQFILDLMRIERDKQQINNLRKNPNYKTVRRHNDIYQGIVNSNNQPDGVGQIFKTDGSYFIGTFQNDKAQGRFFYVIQKMVVTGYMENSQVEGTVTFEGPNYFFEGKYSQGKKQSGQQKTASYSFDGFYENDKKKSGILVLKSQNKEQEYSYTGTFDQKQEFSGQNCKLIEHKGTYTGDFKKGLKHGKGKYEFKDKSGTTYVGDYFQGKKHGRGYLMRKNKGGVLARYYEGQFQDDLPHGKGVLITQGQVKQERIWVKGINQSELI